MFCWDSRPALICEKAIFNYTFNVNFTIMRYLQNLCFFYHTFLSLYTNIQQLFVKNPIQSVENNLQNRRLVGFFRSHFPSSFFFSLFSPSHANPIFLLHGFPLTFEMHSDDGGNATSSSLLFYKFLYSNFEIKHKKHGKTHYLYPTVPASEELRILRVLTEFHTFRVCISRRFGAILQ